MTVSSDAARWSDDAPPISLAVLDLAGTTVQDDGVVMAAFVDAMDEVGIGRDSAGFDTHLDVVRHTMGQSKIEVFRRLLEDEGAAQRANAAFETAYGRRVDAGEVSPLPGAAEAMAGLRATGVRVCVTTGFSAVTRDRLLDRLGWTGLVDLALSPGEGRRGRPTPDLVLAAGLQLGIDDVRAVAVAGDTVSDLLSGHRAGAGLVAGVLTGAHDRDTLASAPHDVLLESIAAFPAVVGAWP